MALSDSGSRWFQYDRPINSTSIRLIQVLDPILNNGTEVRKVMLLLEEHQFDALPKYSALSYTWGPPEVGDQEYTNADKAIVQINGADFEVFPNLLDVLIHLADTSTAEYYWIDAICINQNDYNERNFQVGIMDRIYSLADQVNIWLGKAGPLAEETSDLIRKIAEINTEEYEAQMKNPETVFDGDNRLLQMYDLPGWNDDIWDAFTAFFNRKWFTRVWIIQEVALARTAVVLWGSGKIAWETVASCSRSLGATNVAWALAQRHKSRNKENYTWGETYTNIGVVPGMIDAVDELLQTGFLWPTEAWAVGMGFTAASSSTVTAQLFYLLLVHRSSHATVDKDKVYALLGIVNRISEVRRVPQAALEVQYDPAVSTGNVFTAVAELILRDCNHLGLLTTAVDDSLKKVKNMPSWVPDFTGIGTNTLCMSLSAEDRGPFDASRISTGSPIRIQIDGTILHLKAFCVGTISSVGDSQMEMISYGAFDQSTRMLLSSKETYWPTGQDRIEAFWRTLVCDMDRQHTPVDEALGFSFRMYVVQLILKGAANAKIKGGDIAEYFTSISSFRTLLSADTSNILPSMEHIEHWCEKLGLKDITMDAIGMTDLADDAVVAEFERGFMQYLHLIDSALVHRRPFATTEGYMGIGTESLKLGDTIWIVSGCPTPLILRATSAVGAGPDSSYRLLGESYIHGIMFGEAINGNLQWEDICLS
jgi:hypothetical protein